MSLQKLHSGTRFQLRRKSSTSDVSGVLIAMVVSKDLSRDIKFDEATVIDASAPNDVPVRKSIPTQETADVNISGKADLVSYRQVLESDFEAKIPVGYILKFDEVLANGGGQYEADFYVESLKISTQNNGMVDFTAKLRCDGKMTYTAASA